MNVWIYVIILAVVQGIAEFLPVSSSGHLAVLGALFGFREDRSLALGIVLHAGSLLAILVFYFKTLLGFFRREQFHLPQMVIAGTITAGLAGVALKLSGMDEKLFGEPVMIGLAFLITATLLRLSEKPKLIVRPEAERDLPPTALEAITLRQALVVGVSQMFAILPGLSRSGTTITAGILSGVERSAAGTFSFLLAIPAIGGAAFLELVSLCRDGLPVEEGGVTLPMMAAGLLISALVSFFALSWLTRLIRRGRLSVFSWYLYAIGIAVILWQIAVMARR